MKMHFKNDIAIGVLFMIWSNLEHHKVISILTAIGGLSFMLLGLIKGLNYHEE